MQPRRKIFRRASHGISPSAVELRARNAPQLPRRQMLPKARSLHTLVVLMKNSTTQRL